MHRFMRCFLLLELIRLRVSFLIDVLFLELSVRATIRFVAYPFRAIWFLVAAAGFDESCCTGAWEQSPDKKHTWSKKE